MRKKIFSVWMIVNVLSFVFQVECSFGKEKEPETISRQEAVKAAETFMTESEGNLQEDLNKEITPMYNEKNTVSAYMITFDKGNKHKGYAIIDAEENQGQVIEYSYGEDNFIEKAKDHICEDNKEEKSARIYYLGGLNYVLKTKKGKKITYTDITTSNTKQLPDISKKQNAKYDGSGTKKEGIITNPESCISGTILSSKAYNVPESLNKGKTGIGKYKSYPTMDYYGTENICAPTAGTNLLYHWYNVNSRKYGNLKNNSWTNTFNHLFVLMKTSKQNGTQRENVANAMKIYCKNRGFECRAKTYQDKKKGNNVIEELHHCRPCILHVSDHATYDWHAMLALGYEKYKYKNGKTTITDNYIRVADGWDGRSNRFVWGGFQGGIAYTSVVISVK